MISIESTGSLSEILEKMEDSVMLKGRRIWILIPALILCLSLSAPVRLDAEASGKKEYFDSLSVGISQIVDPTMESADKKELEKLTQMSEADALQKEEESIHQFSRNEPPNKLFNPKWSALNTYTDERH